MKESNRTSRSRCGMCHSEEDDGASPPPFPRSSDTSSSTSACSSKLHHSPYCYETGTRVGPGGRREEQMEPKHVAAFDQHVQELMQQQQEGEPQPDTCCDFKKAAIPQTMYDIESDEAYARERQDQEQKQGQRDLALRSERDHVGPEQQLVGAFTVSNQRNTVVQRTREYQDVETLVTNGVRVNPYTTRSSVDPAAEPRPQEEPSELPIVADVVLHSTATRCS